MPAVIVVGAQWGDEGKGKAVDRLGRGADFVVKYNGGNNAGHTVVVGGQTFALHLVPAGILSPGCVPVIGDGVVVDLEVLFAEIDDLASRGVDCSRLRVSLCAHVLPPYNRVMDQAREAHLGAKKLGTTGRGIGPTYEDKASRVGIRIQDIFHADVLRAKVRAALEVKNTLLTGLYGRDPIDPAGVADQLLGFRDRLRPLVANTTKLLNDGLDAGKTVLFEGGQSTMLDVDHGTYPFVTSSNGSAGGAITGSGVGPTRIRRVVGVAKAYTTRVGSGPFPTELTGEEGEALREKGSEYGVTTGRKRRTGWFDALVGRYSARVNGLTDVVLTKLDVLGGFPAIPVCVAYEIDGRRVQDMPVDQEEFRRAKPVYEQLAGWNEDISGARSFAELPEAARRYVERLEQLIGTRISVVGVGPGRDEVVVRQPIEVGARA